VSFEGFEEDFTGLLKDIEDRRTQRASEGGDKKNLMKSKGKSSRELKAW
jgi:hypothetical protein